MNEHDYIAKTFHLLYGAGDLPYMTLSSSISFTVSRQSGASFYCGLMGIFYKPPCGHARLPCVPQPQNKQTTLPWSMNLSFVSGNVWDNCIIISTALKCKKYSYCFLKIFIICDVVLF